MEKNEELCERVSVKAVTEALYSQTLVIEHNSFQKAVQKVNCSKCETIFPIRIDVNNFNPFQVWKTTFIKYFFSILYHKLYSIMYTINIDRIPTFWCNKIGAT